MFLRSSGRSGLRLVAAMSRVSPLLLLVLVTAIGCAHAPDPVRVSLARIGAGGLARWTGEEPLIVEFQAGDRLPVHLELGGEEFILDPSQPPIELVAKLHCFVRFDNHGIRTSLDGLNFDAPEHPGSFRVGLNAAPGRSPWLDVILKGPRR